MNNENCFGAGNDGLLRLTKTAPKGSQKPDGESSQNWFEFS
ncbi:MAG: hypothetical protein ACI814_002698 [Mariniblastus sp.]|jgi:hypothetical protein